MKLHLVIFYNELRKHIQLALSYRFNIVVTSITAAIVFTAIMFLVGRGSISEANLSEAFIGYVFWIYAGVVITQMSRSVTKEAQTGTLEQMFMSPASPTLLLVARAIGGMLIASAFTLPFLLIVPLVLDFSVPFSWLMIVPVFTTLFGLMGFGLVLGGLTLIYKRTSSVTLLLQNALLFLSGALIPISEFPDWLSVLASLLPTTLGIEVTRDVSLRGLSFMDVWSNGDIPLLIGHSVAYAVIGAFLLQRSVKIVRRRGSINSY